MTFGVMRCRAGVCPIVPSAAAQERIFTTPHRTSPHYSAPFLSRICAPHRTFLTHCLSYLPHLPHHVSHPLHCTAPCDAISHRIWSHPPHRIILHHISTSNHIAHRTAPHRSDFRKDREEAMPASLETKAKRSKVTAVKWPARLRARLLPALSWTEVDTRSCDRMPSWRPTPDLRFLICEWLAAAAFKF